MSSNIFFSTHNSISTFLEPDMIHLICVLSSNVNSCMALECLVPLGIFQLMLVLQCFLDMDDIFFQEDVEA